MKEGKTLCILHTLSMSYNDKSLESKKNIFTSSDTAPV